MTHIILVRHGETEWNRVERFRGRANIPLNNIGVRQAELTGRRIAATWRPVAIYSSPLSRAVKTAQAIAKHFDLTVDFHTGLIDIDYGDWQGLSPDEVRQKWPSALDDWYNAPHLVRIPGGETLVDLRKRAMETVADLAAQHSAETIVMVGHTVTNRIILLRVLGLGNEHFWHIRQETCAINAFELHNGQFTLSLLNETSHLIPLIVKGAQVSSKTI
jgi:probable phosphoglycerate mutase